MDHSAVQDWVTGLGETKSGITVKRAFGVLSAILEECVRERGILANPCVGIKTKRKVSREHVYMTHHDVQKLAREATGHELLVLVLASTKLRWGRDGRPSGQRRRSPTETPERQPERGRGGSRDHRPTPKNHSRRSVPFPAMLQERMLPQCADKLPAALLFPGSGRRVPPTHPDRWQVVGSPAPCAALACRG